jgi:hypothetical protein
MSAHRPRVMTRKPSAKPSANAPDVPGAADRMPSNEELLYELRKHGTKPVPREELPSVSRRTRDYFLTTGVGSGVIVIAVVRVLSESEMAVVIRLALTGVALLCGLLWFIFYGVMSRY